MKIEIEKLRCGEYYCNGNKLVINCSKIQQAFNEKRFNKIPFHDFIESLKNDLRNGIIKKEELEEKMSNYHVERIAYLIDGKKWEEPILIIKDFDPKMEYIDGGHRIWAAECAGLKEVEAIAVDISEQDWNSKKSEIVMKVRQNHGDWLKVFNDMGIKYSSDNS